jgi:3-oxoacyl-[acyl-carrier protein] reductase
MTSIWTEGRTVRAAVRTTAIGEVSMVGHAGTPEDIANAVAFLASPESGFITAQVLTVDGDRMDYIGHP